MSLSANFPEEPWLRLSLGMESVQGGGTAVSSVHPERLFAKSCYERQGVGAVGLVGGWGEGRSWRQQIWHLPREKRPSSLLPLWVPGPCLPFHAWVLPASQTISHP